MSKSKLPWPPVVPAFINGIYYTVDQLAALGPDHDFQNSPDLPVEASVPVKNLTVEDIKRLAEQHGLVVQAPAPDENHDPAADLDDPAKMTEAALKAELAGAGVDFDGRLGRDKLADLVTEHRSKK